MGQSPRHGLHDETWGTGESSIYKEDSPVPSDPELEFQQPEEPRRFLVIGLSGFCEERLVVLTDPEGPMEELTTDVPAGGRSESGQWSSSRRMRVLWKCKLRKRGTWIRMSGPVHK
jgi:hypothetical protein